MSQVVHDYGDICQAITELAIEQRAPISAEEFHTLNRCLDTAIAEAVTEHARMTAAKTSMDETERLGHAAHELRDILNTALLAFNALKRGTVAINGSTGAVLGRSLLRLGQVVDGALAEVRLGLEKQTREPMRVVAFLEELTPAAQLHAEYRLIRFSVEPADPGLTIDADPELLKVAVMNLLQNAFKSERPPKAASCSAHAKATTRVCSLRSRMSAEAYRRAPATPSSRSASGVAGIVRGSAWAFPSLARP